MQYLIDEDLMTDIAVIGRRLGFDVSSVQELGRKGWTDTALLAQAGLERRCIVTANQNDFRRFTNAFAAEGRPHAGVLFVPYTLRSRGAVAVARALVAFERTRGAFPAEYLCDFLQPAE
jgi:hypothetical protein